MLYACDPRVMVLQKASESKGAAPAPAAAEVDSDDESATMKPSAAQKASKHILAQGKPTDGVLLIAWRLSIEDAAAQEVPVATLELEAPSSNLSGDWQQPRTQFVPIGGPNPASGSKPSVSMCRVNLTFNICAASLPSLGFCPASHCLPGWLEAH